MAKQLAPFSFQKFQVNHDRCAHRIGTDSIVLGAWPKLKAKSSILEFGHGSGVISFMLAQSHPSVKITGIEIDASSYEQSLENLERNPFKENITFFQGDFNYQLFSEPFDYIISNPPYFASSLNAPNQERARARHVSKEQFKTWINKWYRLLRDSGELILILPIETWELLRMDFEEAGFFLNRVCRIRHHSQSQIRRLVLGFSKTCPLELIEEDLVLFAEANSKLRSAQYEALVQDFLLPQVD